MSEHKFSPENKSVKPLSIQQFEELKLQYEKGLAEYEMALGATRIIHVANQALNLPRLEQRTVAFGHLIKAIHEDQEMEFMHRPYEFVTPGSKYAAVINHSAMQLHAMGFTDPRLREPGVEVSWTPGDDFNAMINFAEEIKDRERRLMS